MVGQGESGRSISSPAAPSRREGHSAPPKPCRPVDGGLELIGKGAKFGHGISLVAANPLVKRAEFPILHCPLRQLPFRWAR